jgi:hypothetical protein
VALPSILDKPTRKLGGFFVFWIGAFQRKRCPAELFPHLLQSKPTTKVTISCAIRHVETKPIRRDVRATSLVRSS